MLSDWVNGGGDLIAMRPDAQLAGLLGLDRRRLDALQRLPQGRHRQDPGRRHRRPDDAVPRPADRYALTAPPASPTLYSSSTTATSAPAVSVRSVGPTAGSAAAFTYDLARSVVYTRQGNPAWAGQERDGGSPMRSDDLFFGAAAGDPQPDWVDLNKVAIPQADEQQRLLANLVAT